MPGTRWAAQACPVLETAEEWWSRKEVCGRARTGGEALSAPDPRSPRPGCARACDDVTEEVEAAPSAQSHAGLGDHAAAGVHVVAGADLAPTPAA